MDIIQNIIENPNLRDETIPIFVILSTILFKLIQLIASGGNKTKLDLVFNNVKPKNSYFVLD